MSESIFVLCSANSETTQSMDLSGRQRGYLWRSRDFGHRSGRACRLGWKKIWRLSRSPPRRSINDLKGYPRQSEKKIIAKDDQMVEGPSSRGQYVLLRYPSKPPDRLWVIYHGHQLPWYREGLRLDDKQSLFGTSRLRIFRHRLKCPKKCEVLSAVDLDEYYWEDCDERVRTPRTRSLRSDGWNMS